MDKMIFTGGALVGAVNAPRPMARLTISAEKVLLSSYGNMYTFLPQDVIGLEPHGTIPFWRNGVRIVHNRLDCPENVVFWCAGERAAVLHSVTECGFVPIGTGIQRPSGIPIYWRAILAGVLLMHLLFRLSRSQTGVRAQKEFFFIALAVAVFIIAGAIRQSPIAQSLVLKKGRSLDEIRTVLNRAQWTTGIFLVFMLMHSCAKR